MGVYFIPMSLNIVGTHERFLFFQNNGYNGLSSPGINRKFSLRIFLPRRFEFYSLVASPVTPRRDSSDRCLQIPMQGRSLGTPQNEINCVQKPVVERTGVYCLCQHCGHVSMPSLLVTFVVRRRPHTPDKI